MASEYVGQAFVVDADGAEVEVRASLRIGPDGWWGGDLVGRVNWLRMASGKPLFEFALPDGRVGACFVSEFDQADTLQRVTIAGIGEAPFAAIDVQPSPCQIRGCGRSAQALGLCQMHYACCSDTLHFYCERCDQSMTDEIFRFAQYDMRVTLCWRCMEQLGRWETIRATLVATYGPVTEGQVDAAMADWGDRFWITLGPADPEGFLRYHDQGVPRRAKSSLRPGSS